MKRLIHLYIEEEKARKRQGVAGGTMKPLELVFHDQDERAKERSGPGFMDEVVGLARTREGFCVRQDEETIRSRPL
jgi:hypothetical protein